MVWARMRKANRRARTTMFPFRRRWKKVVHCFTMYFRTLFSIPRITIVSGIENYPGACMSCCSDDLALLLPRLDIRSVGSENISAQEKKFRLYAKDEPLRTSGTPLLLPGSMAGIIYHVCCVEFRLVYLVPRLRFAASIQW